MSDPVTIDALLTRALLAYDELTALGEDVEDEWTYVNDLATAWRGRIEEVAGNRADEATSVATGAAVDRLIEEVALIRDPHRAIDWLSTFPQVLLVALDERP